MNNTDNNSISLLHAMYNEILSLKAGQEKAKLEMKAQIEELKLKMKTSIEDLNLEITALQSQLENRNISNQHTSPSVSAIGLICGVVTTSLYNCLNSIRHTCYKSTKKFWVKSLPLLKNTSLELFNIVYRDHSLLNIGF
ncbi:hypothetical protein PHYBLDRAFT_141947 [Phycomyces blakesleeanus NRRL 1555(-)]|uniref:Uncharacterized protein n=1 Tax=Phycomyces blakesleeanus (strain ATCC 8743b / DSM 1359 / FGSC 10004 / NBRC 33097 / NRRL 1555) TaxID=763407 RepID=A0A162UUE8_PHYB8|nr:hypothetical protein PHYBLDRAFT_141947 [Phycomyces blakesleeanus NRRL 1555(-)]OAD78083.1 hypothetical protein PHYBLDRAFT_141947 [Phycomyces blakesleeanus NRRL 1555(-)]|eukprot:XP_018296123.1 hypothetical protein PHYBLDRAFT_141947 [Phycomyces blakesleeanus NRRL 1555(-)]